MNPPSFLREKAGDSEEGQGCSQKQEPALHKEQLLLPSRFQEHQTLLCAPCFPTDNR